MLCAGHHDNIDNGTRYEGLRLRDRISVWDGDGGYHRYYEIVNRETDEVLVKIEIEAPDGRAGEPKSNLVNADEEGFLRSSTPAFLPGASGK